MVENYTLIGKVAVTTASSVTNMRDVTTKVETTPRGDTVVTVAYARDTVVALTLDPAERIALIEALGGHI